ncbi:MAG: hypothetical protein ACUVT7_01715 [Thermoplasmata archaeon]
MHEDVFVAAGDILEEAKRRGIVVRLLGGSAIRMRCPNAHADPALNRKVPDIDLICRKKHSKGLSQMLIEFGATPNSMFNALHGDKRMLFSDVPNSRQIDVFLDLFEMCHTFDFSKRLETDEGTLSLADLMLTKLQIIEINEKDYKDVLCLVIDHGLSEKDEHDSINASYVAELCAGDWGVWRTLTRNIEWVRDFTRKLDIEPEKRELAIGRLNALLARIEKEPKSMRWKMRAKIGEKLVWYDTPDRVGKISLGQ